jgi:hypothetical protein
MPTPKKKTGDYKKCDCGKKWKTRDSLLRDKSVKIIGYQPDFVNNKYNHFLFRHRVKGCGMFFGVRATDFSDLREKECPNELCFGKDDCPGYCTDTFELRVCSVTCRNASDRAIASKIRSRRILKSLKKSVGGTRRAKKKKQPAGTV